MNDWEILASPSLVANQDIPLLKRASTFFMATVIYFPIASWTVSILIDSLDLGISDLLFRQTKKILDNERDIREKSSEFIVNKTLSSKAKGHEVARDHYIALSFLHLCWVELGIYNYPQNDDDKKWASRPICSDIKSALFRHGIFLISPC